jgi:hypothetical protein
MIDKKKMARDCLNDMEIEGCSVEEKLQAMGPLLCLLNRVMTEKEFLGYVDSAHIAMVDPVAERLVRDFANFLHYSGLITLTDPSDDSLLDDTSDAAFRGVTDEDMAKLVSEIEDDILQLSAIIN